jgi:hypothetical protein
MRRWHGRLIGRGFRRLRTAGIRGRGLKRTFGLKVENLVKSNTGVVSTSR